MTPPADLVQLEQGRNAYQRRSWTEAFQALKATAGTLGFGPADYELLATSAFMIGDVAGMLDANGRAYQAYLDDQERLPAARVAIWVASGLASRGKFTEADVWVEKGSRLLEPVEGPCVEKGYLLMPRALRHVMAQELDHVIAISSEAAEIGRDFANADLVALAAHHQARAQVELGMTTEGFRLIDEVMRSVAAGECSPMVTGLVYCSVLECCYQAHEVRRAAEWTSALTEWCGAQRGLVAFNDQCLAHRSEILMLRGNWTHAVEEARRSHENHARGLVAAQAHYQQAEVYRVRGAYQRSEQAYHEVALRGGEPQPGLALLQLRIGAEDAAVASIRRALLETTDLLPRVRLLPGAVEVLLETGHLEDAGRAVSELVAIAEQTSIDMHQAWARFSVGSVALAKRSSVEASSNLKGAIRIWEDLELPYQLALARRDLAKALTQMGDHEGSRIQLEAALAALRDLGADPDVEVVEALLAPEPSSKPFGITSRELEVLQLLSSGATNRSIAEQLVLSERTIDRHVSNIFTKMGVSTRAAATATAIRNEIV